MRQMLHRTLRKWNSAFDEVDSNEENPGMRRDFLLHGKISSVKQNACYNFDTNIEYNHV